MTSGRFFIEKKVGETPLQALERGRRAKHIAPLVPMTYAGRLDPMASGKLLILVGEECKEQKKYHGLDKEYVIEVLFGIASDTGDVLGIVREGSSKTFSPKEIKDVLPSFVGSYSAPYPAYSSKTVEGIPLFEYALQDQEVETPLQQGSIYRIAYKGMRSLTALSLKKYVEKKIATLILDPSESKERGRDFRRTEVLASWNALLTDPTERFQIVKLKVRTSAGVYMRTLAGDIAQKLGTKGLALSIQRTKLFLLF